MSKAHVAITQTVILCGLLYLFFTAPPYIDSGHFIAAISLSVLSLIVRALQKENNILLKRNPFTITNFFLLSLFITIFQIPLEYLFNTFSDISVYDQFFYDNSTISKSILFSSICLVCFNIGQTVNIRQSRSNKGFIADKIINVKPFLIITIFLFLLHLATVDMRYYFGGGAALTGFSLTVHGYLMRFIIIYVFIVVWNLKMVTGKGSAIILYLRKFQLPFLLMIIILSILTIFAGDRGPIIRILLLMAFGYFIVSQKKINFLAFFGLLLSVGYLLSIVKLTGGYSDSMSFTDLFSNAQERFNNSTRLQSISPYTFELAGSIYANNILFSLWNSGTSLYGLGIVTGTLMAFPGGVTLFSMLTGLSGELINSSLLATMVSQQEYGVGTTVIGDALINVGFYGAMLTFIILGLLFAKADYTIYQKKLHFKWGLLSFILIADVIIQARSSIFPSIGVFLFDYIVIHLIIFLMRDKGVKKYAPNILKFKSLA